VLRAAHVSGIDVTAAFQRFAAAAPPRRLGGTFQLSAWLTAIRGATPVTELATRSACSRFSVSRWLSGRSKPRLPDFFRLLDAITGRLPEWAAAFVSISEVPSLHRRFVAAAAAKRLAFETPWTEGVLRVLETAVYRRDRRHRIGFIAECLGISFEQERECLRQLEQAELIERRRSKYIVTGRSTVDTRGGKQALHRLKRHWASVAEQRLLAPRGEDLFAYNVISVSSADLSRIREILRAAFGEIRSLVAASEPEEVAALVNLQLVSFAPK
jgi:hypothetical protein